MNWRLAPVATMSQSLFMNRDDLNRLKNVLIAGTAICLVGCGGDSKPAPIAKSATAPQVATAPREAQFASTTEAKRDAGPPRESIEQSVSAKTPSVAESSQTTTIAPVQRIANPTQAQLSKWRRTPFDSLRLLDCRTMESLGLISHLAPLGDGKHFVVAGNSIVIASVDPSEPLQVVFKPKAEQQIKSLAVSPDGKWIAAGDSEGMLRIWDAAERKEFASKKVDDNDVVELAISPDSREISAISYDSDVSVWAAPLLEEESRFKVNTNGLKRIEYLADGELIAAGETMTTWNTKTGQQARTLNEARYSYALARSPDGVQLALVDQDKLHFWSVAEAKRISNLLGGFASNELLVFSPDGKWLATANGNTIRIWDRASRQAVQAIDAVGFPIVGMEWLPQSQLLVVASVNGRIRIWGGEKHGEAVGLKPLHTTVGTRTADSRTPAMPAQILDAIDLRSFPVLPDSDLRIVSETMLDCESNASVDEAQAFYHYFLKEAGWEYAKKGSAIPDSLEFTKRGVKLVVSFRPEGGKTSISLNVSDNFDLRSAPRFSGAPIEIGYESAQTVMYSTKADLLSIETELLRKMHEAGWTACARLNSSHHEREDARDLEFLQNGVSIHISIGKFPAKPDNYTIQTSSRIVLNAIPIPEDCGLVEFDGSTAPMLVANTQLSLAKAVEFYDETLAEWGWLKREDGRSIKDDRCWLPYIQGQRDLTIELSRMKDDRTLVQVGEGLANTSWQLAKPQSAKAVESFEGIQAADFPILSESKTAKFDAPGKTIEVDMGKIPLPQAGDKYLKAMTDLGWTQDGSGIKENDYVLMNFKKGKAEVTLRARKNEDKAIVNVQGDGLHWTKELPGGKSILSYEAWLRSGGKPAGLSLLDQYEKEMHAISKP